MSLLVCENVSKRYGNVMALNSINLNIFERRIIGLLGPNGSGKTTLIKLITGLLTPTSGRITINGKVPGIESKAVVSYLPDTTYLSEWMKISDIIAYFSDFYRDFEPDKAAEMLAKLNINPAVKLKTLSKGTKEKVQLIMVMSRNAQLYILDEPIAGVDPAARDYILDTILTNYRPEATIILSTHLISDVEKILDDVIFLKNGNIALYGSRNDIVSHEGKTIDQLFREVFRC